MQNSRKNLKIVSGIVLALAILSLINLAWEIIFGELNSAEIPAGSPDNILMITKIFVLVISAIMLIPQTYVGIKGLLIAKKPNSSKLHIYVAMVLFVFMAIEVIVGIVGVFGAENVGERVADLLSLAVDAGIMFEYIVCARGVANAA